MLNAPSAKPHLRLIRGDSATTIIRATCVVTGRTADFALPTVAVREWEAGRLIQDAFPDLSADDREWLISGHSPEAWDALFGEED